MHGFVLLSSTVLAFIVLVTSLPLISYEKQYGVVLDAGSSSTKIRIYSWNNAGENVPTFEEEFFSKVSPGISELQDDTRKVAKYMSTILDLIMDELPDTIWSATPVYFMATAGLRLLDENITKSIIAAIDAFMSDKLVNPFLHDQGFVQILSGEEEALFAWMTINYLNNFFNGKGFPCKLMNLFLDFDQKLENK